MARPSFKALIEDRCNKALEEVQFIGDMIRDGESVGDIAYVLGADPQYVADILNNGIELTVLNYGKDMFCGMRKEVCKLIYEGKSSEYIYSYLSSMGYSIKLRYVKDNTTRESEKIKAMGNIAKKHPGYMEFDGVTLKIDVQKYMEGVNAVGREGKTSDKFIETNKGKDKDISGNDTDDKILDKAESSYGDTMGDGSITNELVHVARVRDNAVSKTLGINESNSVDMHKNGFKKWILNRISRDYSRGDCQIANIDESETVYQSYVHSLGSNFRLFDCIETDSTIKMYVLYTATLSRCAVKNCRGSHLSSRVVPLEFYDIPLKGKIVQVNVVNYKEYTCHDCGRKYSVIDSKLIADVDSIKITYRLRKMCFDYAMHNGMSKFVVSEEYVTENLVSKFMHSKFDYIDKFGFEDNHDHEIDVTKYIETLAEIYYVYGNTHVRWIEPRGNRKIIYISGVADNCSSNCTVCGSRKSLTESILTNITDERLEDKYIVYGHKVISKCSTCGYETEFISGGASKAFEQIECAEGINVCIDGLKEALQHARLVLGDAKQNKLYYRVAAKHLNDCIDSVQGYIRDRDIQCITEGESEIKISVYYEALGNAVEFLKDNMNEISNLRDALGRMCVDGYGVE